MNLDFCVVHSSISHLVIYGSISRRKGIAKNAIPIWEPKVVRRVTHNLVLIASHHYLRMYERLDWAFQIEEASNEMDIKSHAGGVSGQCEVATNGPTIVGGY